MVQDGCQIYPSFLNFGKINQWEIEKYLCFLSFQSHFVKKATRTQLQFKDVIVKFKYCEKNNPRFFKFAKCVFNL